MTRNKLVSIGYLGSKRVYLNVPREEAIRRWEASEGEKFIEDNIDLDEFEFNDEFYAYDVGSPYES